MFNKLKHKISYICGDFNIDLLNPNKHKLTEEFIETLYSLSLFPTITKPTRITGNGATLIDNIFTNNIESNSLSGILINDISDHLPIFVTHDCNYSGKREYNEIKYRRLRTEGTISAFRKKLFK